MTVSCNNDTIFYDSLINQNTKINPRIMHILKLTKYNWVGMGGKVREVEETGTSKFSSSCACPKVNVSAPSGQTKSRSKLIYNFHYILLYQFSLTVISDRNSLRSFL